MSNEKGCYEFYGMSLIFPLWKRNLDFLDLTKKYSFLDWKYRF